jgi:hypothetical protein
MEFRRMAASANFIPDQALELPASDRAARVESLLLSKEILIVAVAHFIGRRNTGAPERMKSDEWMVPTRAEPPTAQAWR